MWDCVLAMVLVGRAVWASPDGCLLRCKDNYLQHMHYLVPENGQAWSLNLATPLQGLFSKHETLNVYDRLSLACDAHKRFIQCLAKCGKSKARSVLEAGQSSWGFICTSFEDNPDFQSEVLPCWTRHGELISKECQVHAVMVQSSVMDVIQNGWADPSASLDDLCRSITLYDKCYIGQSNELCGAKGWKFLLQLNTKNSVVLIQLLSQTTELEIMPRACQQWKYPNEYAAWHSQRLKTNNSMSLNTAKQIVIVILLALLSVINMLYF